MSEFILLLRGNPESASSRTPEELQQTLERYRAWAGAISQQGKMRGGQKLKDDGFRILRRSADGSVACDGPFAETKETIGGFFIIEAGSYAEATALARDCPILDHGTIELREIDPMEG